MPRRHSRALLSALVFLALPLMAAASCQGSGTGPAGDAFYAPPSPLPAGQNGDVIWWRTTTMSGRSDVKAFLVLYRSTDASNQPIAVSGIVLVPNTTVANRPIVAVAPATQGMGDSCAISKTITGGGFPIGVPDITAALDKGFAVAMTDYQGLGTPGEHTYIVGPAMGHAVLDAARAATRLPNTGLARTAPVGLWGYSEGGAGAGWAAELAPTYAPDVPVVGVAAGGVPAQLTDVAHNLDGTTGSGFLFSAAIGFDAAYPELHLTSYLNDAGKAALADVKTQCAAGLFLSYSNKHLTDYIGASNPLDDPAWQARLAQSTLGTRRPTVPALLYHGKTDQIIPYAVGTGLRDRWCGLGAKVQWKDYDSEHIFTQNNASADVTTWLADRFASTPAPSTC